MSSSNDVFWDCAAILLIAVTCLVGGLGIGNGISNSSWEYLVVKRGYAHYDHDTGEFKWNNAPEKAP